MSDREATDRTTLLSLVAIFLGSRAVLMLIALLVEASTPIVPDAQASTAPILRSLTHSDGLWYVGIAASGYHAETVRAGFHDYAFFPLYPILIRIGAVLTGGNLAVAGVLISNAAFGLALLAFERLSRPVLDLRRILIAATILAFGPGAVAFGMAYSDGVFLLLSLLAVLAAERQAYAGMSIAFALAVLTRLPGIVLIVPLALMLATKSQAMSAGGTPARRVRFSRRFSRRLLWLASGPIALAGFLGYLWQLTGDPLAWLHSQAAWNNPPDSFAPPGLPSIPSTVIVLALVGVIGFHLFQLVYLRKSRIPAAHTVYAVIALAALAATARIVSMPRYIAILWPFPWLMTSRRSRAFMAVVVGLAVLSFACFAYLDFTVLAA